MKVTGRRKNPNRDFELKFQEKNSLKEQDKIPLSRRTDTKTINLFITVNEIKERRWY